MKRIAIALRDVIAIPSGADIETAETGSAVGIRLADGRLIRPWIGYEIEKDGEFRDLNHSELEAIGIVEDLEYFEREIDEIASQETR